MTQHEQKRFESPDTVMEFDKGLIEQVDTQAGSIYRLVFEPGWRWSESMKPLEGTELCEAPHLLYQVSGRLRFITQDGDEFEVGPGEVAVVPAGHDAFVVGEERAVSVDFFETTGRPA